MGARMRTSAALRLLVTAGALLGAVSFAQPERILSFEDRIEAQRAIEQVFWNHRIWPADNPGPKPRLEQVMSEADLRAKVEQHLAASTAFEESTGHAITRDELQAEIERMVRDTRDSAVLRELFAALDGDPDVIAECLARPLLLERLQEEQLESEPRAGTLATGGNCMATSAPHALTCTFDSWNSMAPAPLTPRAFHTAVWTGAEMIVWGGADPTQTQTGARYVPATNSWSATSVGTFCPDARKEHSAVWTGIEMIVWGGRGSGDSQGQWRNSGGRYNPMTNSWAPVSVTQNTPYPRSLHSAIWTGSEMVVWGGDSYINARNSGGRYDPVSDTWRILGQGGAFLPEERFEHTAVWTGSEMIVWGGYHTDSYPHEYNLDDGARWSPLTDAWTPIAGAGAPTARSRHSAIWTGSQMIIWGGSGTNTGGRYDPSLDSWTATSITGAPSARSRHVAVWTGQAMIVWGGYYYVTPPLPTSGGRYDPVSDSWTPTSTGTATPGGRWNHTGVWTGTELIAWGGSKGEIWDLWGDGGRYCGSCPTWYRDADGDGHGSPAETQVSCTQPVGYVASNDDCNDADSGVHPGRPEICNAADDDCSAGTADGSGEAWLGGACDGADGDVCQEGEYVCTGGAKTCTDTTATDFESCGNSLDDDCDGLTDAADPDCQLPACPDQDQDLYATCDASCTPREGVLCGDCDDSSAAANPGGSESCNNADDDCDGSIDEGVPKNRYYRDTDNDGFGNGAWSVEACAPPPGWVSDSSDCDDAQASIHPGANEVCNQFDDDCDGSVDEGVKNRYYRDADGDQFGNGMASLEACAAPSGYVSDATDCDDTRATVNPGVGERVSAFNCEDGLDNDCDGLTDAAEPGCAGSVSTPSIPAGPLIAYGGRQVSYRTGGSACDLGDPVEYQFDWGDGLQSNWQGATQNGHAWGATGAYYVMARARCAFHPAVVSPWSGGLAVSVVTQPQNGPDLAGTWKSLKHKCKTKKGVENCTAQAQITVRNAGDQVAGPSRITWAISVDAFRDASDAPLGSASVPSLKPGKTKTITLKYAFPAGTSGRGKYFIAVLDAAGAVTERDELNNELLAQGGP